MFRLSEAVGAVPALLHVSSLSGSSTFLFSINDIVAHALFGIVLFFDAIYLLMFLPNIRPNCLYRAPFSRNALKWLLFSPTAPVLLALAGMSRLVHRDKLEHSIHPSLKRLALCLYHVQQLSLPLLQTPCRVSLLTCWARW